MEYQRGHETRVRGGFGFGPVVRRRTRWLWPSTLAFALLMLATACTQAGQDGLDPASSTPGSEAGAGTTDSPVSTELRIPDGLPVAEPVDPDGELDCERFGYPCDWSDVPEELDRRVDEVWAELKEIVDAEESPKVGIEQGLAFLAGLPDLVEVGADPQFYTAISFRLEGAPPAVVHTITAGMAGEADPYDGPPIQVNPPEQANSDGAQGLLAGLGWPPGSVLADFRPAGGPLEQKKALVLDPYATKATDCGGGIPDSQCYKEVAKDRAEGALVAAILSSHSQIEVTYLPGQRANPENAGAISGYDLVHIASHGGLVCGLEPDGFSGVCDSTVQVFSPDSHRGLRSELFGQITSEMILYVSACTSGAGRFAQAIDNPQRPGIVNVGAFVGWGDYADVGEAQNVAIHFWRLMVEEGISFDLAYNDIVERGMNSHEMTHLSLKEWAFDDEELSLRVWSAHLIAKGENLRARDVIETTFGSASSSADGGVLVETDGFVDDGVPERIDEVTFKVEGVEEGTEDNTRIEFYIDGKQVDKEIIVGDGRPTSGGSGYADWEVTVEDLSIGRDLKSEDVATDNPPKVSWEARVFVDENEYSADRSEVVFNAESAPCEVSATWTGVSEGTAVAERRDVGYIVLPGPKLLRLEADMFAIGVVHPDVVIKVDEPGVYTGWEPASVAVIAPFTDPFEDIFGEILSFTIDRVENVRGSHFTSVGTFTGHIVNYPGPEQIGSISGEFTLDTAGCSFVMG